MNQRSSYGSPDVKLWINGDLANAVKEKIRIGGQVMDHPRLSYGSTEVKLWIGGQVMDWRSSYGSTEVKLQSPEVKMEFWI